MARFPLREAKTKSLVQNILNGRADNVVVFPAPSIAAVALESNEPVFSASPFKLHTSHFNDWEYRIIVVNKAGQGEPVNMVAPVVL